MARPRRGPSLTVVGHACGVVAVLALTAYGWISTGSPATLVTSWLLTVVGGIMLPGVAITRVLTRPAPGWWSSLGWSGPVGLTFVLLVWLLRHLVGLQVPVIVCGVVVCAVLLTVPATRARITQGIAIRRGSSSAATPPAAVWSVVVALLVTARSCWPGLAQVAPSPLAGRPIYYQDLPYQVALTGELRRSLRPGYPMVNGEPLEYHWFYHAIASVLGGNGADDVDVVTRLLPVTLLLMLTGIAATVGRHLVRRPAGASGAALAVAFAGPVIADSWSPHALPPLIPAYWQGSPTQTLGWVAGVALVGCVTAAVGNRPGEHGVPVAMLPAFAVLAAGAKSSQVPVVLAGAALAGGAWLLAGRRQQQPYWRTVRRHLAVGAVMAAALLFAVRVLYPSSYGLTWDPDVIRHRGVLDLMPGLVANGADEPDWAGLTLLARELGPQLGLAVGGLYLIRRRFTDPAGWIAVGALAAGVVTRWGFTHPGNSQYYFMISAVPVAATVSGAGLGVAVSSLSAKAEVLVTQWRGRLGGALGGALLVTVGLAAGLLTRTAFGSASPLQRWTQAFGHAPLGNEVSLAHQVMSWLAPSLTLLGVLTAAAAVGTLVLRRRHGAGRGTSLGLLALLVFGASLPTTVSVLTTSQADIDQYFAGVIKTERRLGRPVLTPALFEAGQYVRAHAAPTDVVATNRVYQRPRHSAYPDPRDFTVSAFTGLRTDVSGYAYAGRAFEEGQRLGVHPFRASFWDPGRLAANDALFTTPSTERLETAYRDRGVRWIVADERSGPVSTGLAALADEVFDRDRVHVFRLRAP